MAGQISMTYAEKVCVPFYAGLIVLIAITVMVRSMMVTISHLPFLLLFSCFALSSFFWVVTDTAALPLRAQCSPRRSSL